MVRRRNIQSKTRLSAKKLSRRANRTIQPTTSSTTYTVKHNPSESLDDETKLAKRHLTKEMWQLVSIAVKRMADELVSISNNQQPVTRTVHQDPQTTSVDTIQSSTVQQPTIKNTGAGDVPFLKEKSIVFKEPIQMLEPSGNIKKKGISNNATRRSIKSKVQNKSSKKNGKLPTQRLRNNYKFK
jgi:hypothetical protein